MPSILYQRLLHQSLAAASTFMVGVAIVLPGLAQAGSERPLQSAVAPSQEIHPSADYMRTAANDGQEDDDAGSGSGQIDDLTLSVGRVVSVNAADSNITIEHRPIARFYMEPMIMIFRVKDRTLLVGLTAGDKIRFKVEQDGVGFVVTRLEHSN